MRRIPQALSRALPLGERGSALPLAIVTSAALAISTAAMATLMVSNQGSAARGRDTARAFNVAEAGLSNALSVISQADPNGATAVGATLGPTAFSLDGGSGTYSATKTAPLEWTISAAGTSPTGSVTRNLELTVSASTQTTGSAASPAYGYGFFMGSPTADCTVSGGTTISNSALLTVPVYVASSLCLSGGGSPQIAEPSSSAGGTIPLYVGGMFSTQGNSSPVGTSAKRIASATVVGGCRISFHGWKNVLCDQQGVPTSGTGSGIWANSYSSAPLDIQKPTVDPAYWYANAKPGPAHACGAGSTVGPLVFDNDATRNTSLGNRRLLMLTGSSGAGNNFDCKYYDGSGNLIGRLAWTFGTPGTLTIQGTVFIDGNLTVAGNDKAVYQGHGTIYVNGTVSMSNGARICGAPMSGSVCSGNWNPSNNSLMIVAVNAANANPGFNMQGDSQFEGLAYTNGRYTSANSAWTSGPVIADTGTLSGNTKFKAIETPPPGAPGGSTAVTTTVWTAVPGSWRQLTN